MFVDPDNPFASPPPKKGSVPNPFGPEAGEKKPIQNQPERIPSPFEIPPKSRESSIPPKARPSSISNSPFALAKEKPEEPSLAEPMDGFAMPESIPEVKPEPPARIKREVKREEISLEDDPFALPTPQNRAKPIEASATFAGSQSPESQLVERVEDVSPVCEIPEIEEVMEGGDPSSVTGGDNEMPQLVLRAIFGVGHEMARDEILERASSLPGVRLIQTATLEDVGAIAQLRSGVVRMGFGDPNKVSIHTDAGVLDIIEERGTALAVLRDGEYGAGIREALIIVARELARLS